MQSYNQIIKLNREFAEAHYQIKTFGNGAAYNIVLHDKEPWFEYPLMWIEDSPATLNNNEFQFNFRVYFIQQVAQLEEQDNDLDSTNENEAKSDMIQCAQDLLSFWAQDTTYPELDLIKTGNSFTTITDKFSDRVTGCYIDLRLKQGFTYNKCAIPMSGVTPPPSVVCLPATVTVNDEEFDTVASGGFLNVPIRYVNGEAVPITITEGEVIIANPVVCSDATITVNTDPFQTVPSGGTLDVEVEYQTQPESPIHSIVGNKIIITDPVVIPTDRIYLRPSPTGEIYDALDPTNYPIGCDSWRVITGQDISAQPSSGTIMYLDKTNVSKVVPDNIFGHKFRITGLTGGYFNADTGNYHDADGTVSDRATAFPDDYFIDHHTGLGGKITASASLTNWSTSLTEIDALSFAGFDDYFLPNLNEQKSILNYGHPSPLGQSAFPICLPPFDQLTNNNKWTSTTYKALIIRVWGIAAAGSTATPLKTDTNNRYMAFRYHFNNA